MSGSSNEPPPSNPFLDYYQKFSQETPFVTRSILTIQAVSYLASWLANPQYSLGNIPQFTILNFEVYRILLSPLVNDNLFSLLFAFLSFKDLGRRLEYSLGSTAFAWLCLMLGCLTNVIFLVLSFAFYFMTNDRSYLISSCSGIWIILFGAIALECVRAPQGTKRRFFFTEVPVLYYPASLYALFAFISFALLPGQLISMGLGYALGFASAGSFPGVAPLERAILIDSAKTKDLEDRYLSSVSGSPGWVTSHAATGSGAWNEDEETGMQLPLFQNTQVGPVDEGEQDTGSSFGSVFRDPRGSQDQIRPMDEPGSSGRALGGATRRVVSASEARAARLNALEKRQSEGE